MEFSTLRALFINCTLAPSPRPSHTQTLIDEAVFIMRRQGVAVECVRAVDHDLAPGVQPDMTRHGFERDEWPALWRRVLAAHILVLATPIWLGDRSSVCSRVIERLYAHSGQQNERGQFIFYGKVGGCLVTGNEDGIKHVARDVLYALQHVGCAVPPQADAGWIGEAGPGESYGDPVAGGGRAGFDNAFTQRSTTFMAWNLMHLARLLAAADGFPAGGNQQSEWDRGVRSGHPSQGRRVT